VAGSFIGQKLVVNEFVAYLNFAPYLKDEVLINGVAMSDHTKAIISSPCAASPTCPPSPSCWVVWAPWHRTVAAPSPSSV
jgi:hypothetical protein